MKIQRVEIKGFKEVLPRRPKESENLSFVSYSWQVKKKKLHSQNNHVFQTRVVLVLGSIVVSIPACHAGDRGSIPRRGGRIFFVVVVVVVVFFV